MFFLSPPSIELMGLLVVVFLIALLPTRRLYLAGWRPRSLMSYLVVLMALGLVVVELRAVARFLVPMLVIAYIAPFVTAPVIERVMGPRNGRRPPPRDVTPRSTDSGRDAGAGRRGR